MNNQQLIQVQRAIERFFVKVRVNITLHEILRSELCISFQRDMKLAIENQILYFAKVEKVNQVVGVKKIDSELLRNIFLSFPLLQEFIDKQDFNNYLQTISDKGVQSAKNVLGVDQDFVVEDLTKLINKRIKESMGGIDDTTIAWIAQRLSDGIKSGASSYEIAKLLRDLARDQAGMRAEMIAEQEAAWMLGETQLEVYGMAGVEKKKLITSRDELVCVICIADEEAGEIDVKDSFPSGEETTPIHIRCRCFVMPVTRIPIAIE